MPLALRRATPPCSARASFVLSAMLCGRARRARRAGHQYARDLNSWGHRHEDPPRRRRRIAAALSAAWSARTTCSTDDRHAGLAHRLSQRPPTSPGVELVGSSSATRSSTSRVGDRCRDNRDLLIAPQRGWISSSAPRRPRLALSWSRTRRRGAAIRANASRHSRRCRRARTRTTHLQRLARRDWQADLFDRVHIRPGRAGPDTTRAGRGQRGVVLTLVSGVATELHRAALARPPAEIAQATAHRFGSTLRIFRERGCARSRHDRQDRAVTDPLADAAGARRDPAVPADHRDAGGT